MLTREDSVTLKKRGIPLSKIEEQLSFIAKGFPYLRLKGSATEGNGIVLLSSEDEDKYVNEWDEFLKSQAKVVKFVPASGAASRMFKSLFEFLDGESEKPQTDSEKKFFSRIHDFAFADDLDKVCLKNNGKSIDQLVASGDFKSVVRNLLSQEGLNYGSLPKGLLIFHSYKDGTRKPIDEHLAEGKLYAINGDKTVNIHFTVSHEHKKLFMDEIVNSVKAAEKGSDVKFDISFSEQKPETDTIAADMDNQPFRENGEMLFRPGGHGALIENLNDLDADIVFIKNIDNVVPDRLKDTTARYKKILAGILVSYQKKAFKYIKLIESGKYSHEDIVEITQFLQRNFCTRNPETKLLEDSELVLYLKNKLNRPIRICGMVKNLGEPGGGPFWAYNQDGTYSLQILESSQIDLNNPESKEMFEKGTHFNPVDLVCSLRNSKGEKFNLPDYVDKQTGFISQKSKNGKKLKALELPGLWNGAMSDWNTVFVEVPILTFNPVKTVNDLLRPEHQPA